MDPQLMIALASVAGAVLFFTTGFLWNSVQVRRAGGVSETVDTAELRTRYRELEQQAGQLRRDAEVSRRFENQYEDLRRQHDALKEAYAKLAKRDPATRDTAATAIEAALPEPSRLPERTSADLEGALSELVRGRECEAVTISDTDGLVVAGHGSAARSDEIAAIVALFHRAAPTTLGRGSFSTVRSLELSDEDNRWLSCQSFEWNGQTLYASAVGSGGLTHPLADDKNLAKVFGSYMQSS